MAARATLPRLAWGREAWLALVDHDAGLVGAPNRPVGVTPMEAATAGAPVVVRALRLNEDGVGRLGWARDDGSSRVLRLVPPI